MTKIFLFVLTYSLVLFNSACQSKTAPNANANSANSLTNIDPKNMPPGLSGSPVPATGEATPGIPSANAVAPPKGATPTPGIPADAGKPLPKGATPTPGIPDPETLKKQMNQTTNANAANLPRSDAGATTDGEIRPRTVRKP
jgi:hypothetical protein